MKVTGVKVTASGASGFIGTRLTARLQERGDEVTVLSPPGNVASSSAGAVAWDPMRDPAPLGALSGRDAGIHLTGEPVAQRWDEDAKRHILDSRVIGTWGGVPAQGRPSLVIAHCGPRAGGRERGGLHGHCGRQADVF